MKKFICVIALFFLFGCSDYKGDECISQNIIKSGKNKNLNQNYVEHLAKNLDVKDTNYYDPETGAHVCYVKGKVKTDDGLFYLDLDDYLIYNYKDNDFMNIKYRKRYNINVIQDPLELFSDSDNNVEVKNICKEQKFCLIHGKKICFTYNFKCEGKNLKFSYLSYIKNHIIIISLIILIGMINGIQQK